MLVGGDYVFDCEALGLYQFAVVSRLVQGVEIHVRVVNASPKVVESQSSN